MEEKILRSYGVTEEEVCKLARWKGHSKLLTDGLDKGKDVCYNLEVTAYAELMVTKDNGEYDYSKLYFRTAQGVWYRVSSYGFIKEFRACYYEFTKGLTEQVKCCDEKVMVPICVSIIYDALGRHSYHVEKGKG